MAKKLTKERDNGNFWETHSQLSKLFQKRDSRPFRNEAKPQPSQPDVALSFSLFLSWLHEISPCRLHEGVPSLRPPKRNDDLQFFKRKNTISTPKTNVKPLQKLQQHLRKTIVCK
jgi:hypothetical protein